MTLERFSRYVAVHVPATHPTVELRMFRGTLNVASFWKNLECAKALLEFVTTNTTKDMTDTAFVAHVVANEKKYPHLSTFLTTEQKKPRPRKSDNEPIHPEKLKRLVTAEDFTTLSC